jgi:hypothetical protein
MRSFFLRTLTVAVLLSPTAALAQATSTMAPASGTNPPGTAVSRTFDRAAGTNTSGAYPSQADGTAENPKGTAVSRAAHHARVRTHHAASGTAQSVKEGSASRTLDRVAGTDNSGAYPKQADGTPGNPRGTVVSRALGTTDPK